MKEEIDFVVLWVDGNDIKWREAKEKYEKRYHIYNESNVEARYRDWGLFRYWFRAVEKFAPWVRHVYLVTCGQVPEWLNINHPKLRLINHEDFIEKGCLPTFNSSAIEINLHKIKGLGEYFVYFNDDIFLTQHVRPEDFFQGGKPLICAAGFPLRNYASNSVWRHNLFSMLGYARKYNWEEIIKKQPEKWFNYKYGKFMRYNWRMFREAYMSGFFYVHFASPFRKSTLIKTEKEFKKEFEETCGNKFRCPNDVTQLIFKIHDIANGNFTPCSPKHYGFYYDIVHDLNTIIAAIKEEKNLMVCVNDIPDVTKDNYEHIRNSICEALVSVLPEKSSFEK